MREVYLLMPLKGKGAEVNTLKPQELIISLYILYNSSKKNSTLTCRGNKLLCLLTIEVCLHWKKIYIHPYWEGHVSKESQDSLFVYSTLCISTEATKRVLVNTSGFYDRSFGNQEAEKHGQLISYRLLISYKRPQNDFPFHSIVLGNYKVERLKYILKDPLT